MKFNQINHLTDDIMPTVKPNTFKVIMTIARATWGWKKECAKISFNDFQEATGISGRTTLNNAIKDALDSEYVIREGEGNTFCYQMTSTEIVPNQDDSQYGNRTKSSTEIVPRQYGNRTENGTEIVPNNSTAKETKEIYKETIREGNGDCSLSAVYTSYSDNIGGLNKVMSDDIADAYKDYGGQWIIDAIAEAVRNGVYKWRYVQAILKNWKSNGRNSGTRNQTANTVKQADDAAGGVYV